MKRVVDTDHDGDGYDGDGYYDNLDVIEFGHAASALDRRSIASQIERYHAATAAHAGASACASLIAGLASALAGEPSTQSQAGESACGNALDKQLRQLAGKSDASLANVSITRVRVKRAEARAMVRLPSGEERYVPLIREGRRWMIGTVFDIGMI